MDKTRNGQKAYSLLELLTASFIGIVAVTGILYVYKIQHKSMLTQTSISEMRMNGQFTLNEAQLTRAG